ncbi:tyrosine-type recombinase/integrase, partial [Alphaproteobacteria bacterium]|nr:tyrosine-type recombinase/integrase [Alphaproteobacteria bacterium]
MTYNQSSYIRVRFGVYHFVRRVPADVKQHYRSDRVSISLRTKSAKTATRSAQSISQRLDDYWHGLRLQKMDVPALHLVINNSDDVIDDSPTMMEAVDIYLRLKSDKQTPTFIRAAKRNGRYVAEALGNRPITSYSSSDAAAFRDYLFDKGLALGSVKRIFGSVRSIINLVMQEYGIDGANGFAKTYMPEKDDSQDRQPIPPEKLIKLQQACVKADDEMRWLLAIISDTGMRLSEAAGLHKDDIILDAPIPYINLQRHLWRRLKTKGSARHVPLIGASLWAARRLQQHDSSYAFPRYCDGRICNANSASAALNKWMKLTIGNGYVVHGLRHSLRDRLRAVECPSDIIDAIGGWTTTGIGHAYGKGYTVDILAKWMR